MPQEFTHPLYSRALERWRFTRAACDPELIRERKWEYLPKLADHEDDPTRYNSYWMRAYYVNVTGRTRDGLTGAAFRECPLIELPPAIEYLREDADGAGMSLEQVGKMVVADLMETGRYGLLVDYPPAQEGMSREETQALAAHIACYKAENIQNWRYSTESGRLRLSMVLLSERDTKEIDEFQIEEVDRYRVLRLRDGVYTQQLLDRAMQPLEDERTPRKADGSTWDHIPFHFAGALDNRPDIGPTPLYDIATINIAQYRNIADREETLHIAGQPTLFVSSDIDLETFRQANPNGIRVGARKGHFLGPNGNAFMLQAQAVDAHDAAIRHKAEQMVSIGARLITSETVQQTAEAARIAASGEHSALSTLVGNASEALEAALEDAALFMGGDPAAVRYQISTDFWEESADPQLIMQMIQAADRGDIARTDMRAYLRRTGLIDSDRTDMDIDGDVAGQGIVP